MNFIAGQPLFKSKLVITEYTDNKLTVKLVNQIVTNCH